MRMRVASVVLVSTMGLGAVGTLAVSPSWAETAATATSDRTARIAGALKGLVSDGSITQAQADEVASTLAAALPEHGPGGHGGRGGGRLLEPAATILGMSVADLRTALEGGKSLAAVAESKGISKSALIGKLVAAAQERLAADVRAGRLTQAQADLRKADLTARVTERVERVGPPSRPGPRPDSSSTTSSTT